MAKPTEFDVVLVRSGATEWDETGRLVGAADLPLSAAGRAALLEATESLSGSSLCTVLCGPDESSRATADLIASRDRIKPKAVEDLAEVGLGLWEGLLESDVEDRYPTAYRQWLENPAGVSIPEGEPLFEARERIVTALCKTIEKCKPVEGKLVVLVLRPLAMALVKDVLEGVDEPRVVREMLDLEPVVSVRLNRAALKESKTRLRAAV